MRKPKIPAAAAPARKSRLPSKPLKRIGGVESLHSGLKTLSVVAARPPPDADRPPSKSWNMSDDRMAGLEWLLVERTAPEIGKERVRPSMMGRMVSRIAGLGRRAMIPGLVMNR